MNLAQHFRLIGATLRPPIVVVEEVGRDRDSLPACVAVEKVEQHASVKFLTSGASSTRRTAARAFANVPRNRFERRDLAL
jgi:hypothetical protein